MSQPQTKTDAEIAADKAAMYAARAKHYGTKPPPNPADWQAQALAFAATVVDKLFDGRKGHGGGPCSKRVMDRHELQCVIATAFQMGREAAK